MQERKRIGEILVDLGVLSPSDVERVLAAQRRRRDRSKFGQIARDMGLIREEHILAALAVQMQLFPGIGELSLHRLLDELSAPPPSDAPSETVPRRTVARRTSKPGSS